MRGSGHSDRTLSEGEAAGIVRSFLAEQDLDGERVLVVVPNAVEVLYRLREERAAKKP